MNCSKFEQLIYLYGNQELTQTEEQLLMNHIGECHKCRQLYGELQTMNSIINSGNPDFAENHDLSLSIMKTLESENFFSNKENSSSSPGSRKLRLIMKTAIAASVLTLTFQMGSILNSRYELENRFTNSSYRIESDATRFRKQASRLLLTGTIPSNIQQNHSENTEIVISKRELEILMQEIKRVSRKQQKLYSILKEAIPELSEVNPEDGLTRKELEIVLKKRNKIQRILNSY